MKKKLSLSCALALSFAVAGVLRADSTAEKVTPDNKTVTQSSSATATATASGSSNGKPVVHTQTGGGGHASATSTVTVNGKTNTVHSESHDGKPETVTADGNAPANANVPANPQPLVAPDANAAMKEATAQMEQQIKDSNMPEESKQQLLKMLHDMPQQ